MALVECLFMLEGGGCHGVRDIAHEVHKGAVLLDVVHTWAVSFRVEINIFLIIYNKKLYILYDNIYDNI
jgi:hypothetical protein